MQIYNPLRCEIAQKCNRLTMLEPLEAVLANTVISTSGGVGVDIEPLEAAWQIRSLALPVVWG